MMNNQHPVDLLPGYALSVLDDADMQEVRAHIHACDECQQELTQITRELTQMSHDVPRARVRRQLFAHINFDMDMREALREGARRTSLRWIWGAFLLITGSIVASLLMWSGMQQREILANERTPRQVVTADGVIVQFLAQPGVQRLEFVPVQSAVSAVMHMYYQDMGAQALFMASGLDPATQYVVWLMDDVKVHKLGHLLPDDDGVAWMQTQLVSNCVRCNILVTREQKSNPVEPSNDWQFELIVARP